MSHALALTRPHVFVIFSMGQAGFLYVLFIFIITKQGLDWVWSLEPWSVYGPSVVSCKQNKHPLGVVTCFM